MHCTDRFGFCLLDEFSDHNKVSWSPLISLVFEVFLVEFSVVKFLQVFCSQKQPDRVLGKYIYFFFDSFQIIGLLGIRRGGFHGLWYFMGNGIMNGIFFAVTGGIGIFAASEPSNCR